MRIRRKRPGRGDPIPDSPLDRDGNPVYAGPSRSQTRREASAVSDLALRLTKLPKVRLGQLPLDEELRAAVDLADQLTRNAYARHLRLIAKLLRDLPDETLETVERLSSPNYRPGPTREERLAERWRTRLLQEGAAALGELFAEHPGAERQRLRLLRQLIRQAKVTPATDRSKRAARDLLRTVRALLPSDPEDAPQEPLEG